MSYRKLGRNSAARKALFTSILTSFFRYGRIETTEAKAKELRKFAENLITLAKRGDLSARRQAIAELADEDVVRKLFDEIAGKTARAVTRVSSSSAFAAAMLLRWSSSNSCNPFRIYGHTKAVCHKQAVFFYAQVYVNSFCRLC